MALVGNGKQAKPGNWNGNEPLKTEGSDTFRLVSTSNIIIATCPHFHTAVEPAIVGNADGTVGAKVPSGVQGESPGSEVRVRSRPNAEYFFAYQIVKLTFNFAH